MVTPFIRRQAQYAHRATVGQSSLSVAGGASTDMLSKLKVLICCPPELDSKRTQTHRPGRQTGVAAVVGAAVPVEQSRRSAPEADIELPDVLYDANDCRRFHTGQLLGRGTFGRCYKLVDVATGQDYAAKIISKRLHISTLYTPTEMAAREITVQRHLKHPHIVRFESFFEDADRIYILLELCSRGSLRGLLQRRKSLTEYECRYFIHQLVLGVQYLHDYRIIHRDLKQENLLLDEHMQLKIGDFGLATHLSHAGERKQMQCGTPDYTAPEVLSGEGYSLEVDIWAIGCVLYELLHGKPPFDSETLEGTIRKVRAAEYVLSCEMSPAASNMISQLLQLHPPSRPGAQELLRHEFLRHADLVKSLSNACLILAPPTKKANAALHAQRQTLGATIKL